MTFQHLNLYHHDESAREGARQRDVIKTDLKMPRFMSVGNFRKGARKGNQGFEAILLLVTAAMISVVGGTLGGAFIADQRADEYHEGIALLDGSGAYLNAHGLANFKVTPEGDIFKLQISGAPELANSLVTIQIATTSLADAVTVGTFKLDGVGKGNLTIKAKTGQAFPDVINGTQVLLKTASSATVAEGFFGAP